MSRRPYEALAAQLALADEMAAALRLENQSLRAQLALVEAQLAAANADLERARGEIQELDACNESMRQCVNDANAAGASPLGRALLGASLGALADGAQRLADAQTMEVEEPT